MLPMFFGTRCCHVGNPGCFTYKPRLLASPEGRPAGATQGAHSRPQQLQSRGLLPRPVAGTPRWPRALPLPSCDPGGHHLFIHLPASGMNLSPSWGSCMCYQPSTITKNFFSIQKAAGVGRFQHPGGPATSHRRPRPGWRVGGGERSLLEGSVGARWLGTGPHHFGLGVTITSECPLSEILNSDLQASDLNV